MTRISVTLRSTRFYLFSLIVSGASIISQVSHALLQQQPPQRITPSFHHHHRQQQEEQSLTFATFPRFLSSSSSSSSSDDKNYETQVSSDNKVAAFSANERRQILKTMTSSALLLLPFSNNDNSNNNVANAVVQRAVGGAEIDCRAAGNCLDIGQLDGAVGWSWGGKDRCDATNPLCGPDGKLGTALPQGQPVPNPVGKITHVAEIIIDIGREETGLLHLGFYGEECPGSVKQIVSFLTTGISTTSSLMYENGMGIKSSPVSLLQGGKIPDIVPGKLVDFGIESQSIAFSRARGLRNAGDNFVPQPRPSPDEIKNDPFLRQHDVAGLVSIPAKGIGYGGNGFESDDEAYESAFQITAGAVPALDKAKRRVIGQVIDEESMAFLARLAALPTKKGLKGVIPGQTSGPPLLKITIRDVDVKKV